MVRYGRAGLSSFHWLPGGFGDEVADTGLTRPMVAAEAWKKIDAHDIGGDDDDWDGQLRSLMAPQLGGRAATGRLGLVEGIALSPADARWHDLVSVRRSDHHLFLRYRSREA